MKKITAIQIAIIFILGLIPILWLRDGYIISNGDNIPASLNAVKTFSSSFNMWSPDFLGYASPNPSYLLNTYLAVFFTDLGLSVGVIQILFQILLYMGAGFSMYYFTRTIYPDHNLAPFFAALFYMLNFFILMSRFNLGFAWTYAFLPLILALFVVSVNAAYRRDKKAANMGIIGFAIVSILPFSIASVNPANIALFLISLLVLAIYFLVKYRKTLMPLVLTLGKMVPVTILVNIWWLFPMINTFFLSPQSLGVSVNVASWSWTHQRASFLNLFWLNGTWGWNTYYIPKPLFDYYNIPVVAFLMFIPFILAGIALLFRSNKSRFNAFIAFCILVFVFLAKGLHDPLEQINLLLYQTVPLMNMFREPASKFTLIIIPFLALLIGFAADRIIKMAMPFRHKVTKSLKIVFIAFLVGSFVISALPIFKIPVNFADTETENISSSYIQIPQYWFQATDWINNQQGDWKVLLTPLDDFYEMPYVWGYYGIDVLLERLFEKPIVSTSSLDGYINNPGPAADLWQIKEAVKFNRTDEFKAFLDLLCIKYIVQRNDVDIAAFRQSEMFNDVNVTKFERNLKAPEEMKAFFANQSYLKLVRSFGELEIYEYSEAKPSIFALLPSTLKNTDIYIDKSTRNVTWNFSFEDDFKAWNISSHSDQSLAESLKIQNGNLVADVENLPSGWWTVDSPLINADVESSYLISLLVSAKNNRNVTFTIAEYSENKTLLKTSFFEEIKAGNGTFDPRSISFRFEPQNENTKHFRIQIWNYFDVTETSESSLMIDNVGVFGANSTLNMIGLNKIYQDMEQNRNILQIKSVNITKTVIAVNTTQPFILATTQSLDKSWVAIVNGVPVSPISTYLGLKGFLINQTGQFDVTVEYKPQQWFNYSIVISGVTVLFLCLVVLYLQRIQLKGAYRKIRKPKS
jgi:hypothetical protein